MVQAQRVVAFFIDAQNTGHMRIRQQPHIARVVRTIDDDFMKAEPSIRRRRCCKLRMGCSSLDNAANLLGITRTAHGSLFAGYRSTSGGVLLSFPGQNGQLSTNSGIGLHHAMRGQFFGPLGPFGGDNDPFLGEKVLAKLGHVNPSSFSHRHGGIPADARVLRLMARKSTSFRYLRRPALALNTSLVLPRPELEEERRNLPPPTVIEFQVLL